MNQKVPRNLSPQELFEWLKNDDSKPILIDVREDSELKIARFPSITLHMPLSNFEDWSNTLDQKISLDQPIVVICHSGIRSWNFATWLIEQDSRYEVCNLAGGIDAWSIEIDQSIPRY